MKNFTANRLAGGNRIFPAEIHIDNFGVHLKIPGLFSGQQKSLGFDKISSIKIDSPMIGFSKITFDTIGWDYVVAEGFEKADAEEIKQLVQMGIQSVRHGHSGGNSGGSHVDLSHHIAQSEAIKAQAEVEKRKLDLEEAKHDAEQAEIKRLREAEEKKVRIANANDLRSQGKNKQAFFVEHGKTLGIIGGAVIIGIICLFIFLSGNGDAKLDADLTRKADKVETLIHEGKKDEARKLVEELQHDSQGESHHSKGIFNYTYSEYWEQRRKELRNQIDGMNAQLSSAQPATVQPAPPIQGQSAPAIQEQPAPPKTDTTSTDQQPTAQQQPTQESPKTIVYYKINDGFKHTNLFKEPKLNGEVIRKVFSTEKFEIIGEEGVFKKVKFDDATIGYVHRSTVIQIK